MIYTLALAALLPAAAVLAAPAPMPTPVRILPIVNSHTVHPKSQNQLTSPHLTPPPNHPTNPSPSLAGHPHRRLSAHVPGGADRVHEPRRRPLRAGPVPDVDHHRGHLQHARVRAQARRHQRRRRVRLLPDLGHVDVALRRRQVDRARRRGYRPYGAAEECLDCECLLVLFFSL